MHLQWHSIFCVGEKKKQWDRMQKQLQRGIKESIIICFNF